MKKYLSLIAICLSSFVHGSGFANLKNIQDRFHALIYQAGDLGATQPAPEVPYIAGLREMNNQAGSINGTPDACHIYGILYDRPNGATRKVTAGVDQVKADAFYALPFDFSCFNQYQRSGHSVLGVAAQEVVAAAATPSLSPPPSTKTGGGGGIFSGGNPFAGGQASLVAGKTKPVAIGTPSSPSQSVAAAVPQSLRQRVQAKLETLGTKQRKSNNNNADIAILSEFADELSGARKRDEAEQERYKDLSNFFRTLEDSSNPMSAAALGGLRIKLQKEALRKFPQQASSPQSPVNAATSGGGNANGAPSPAAMMPTVEVVDQLLEAVGRGSSRTKVDDQYILNELLDKLRATGGGESSADAARYNQSIEFYDLLKKQTDEQSMDSTETRRLETLRDQLKKKTPALFANSKMNKHFVLETAEQKAANITALIEKALSGKSMRQAGTLEAAIDDCFNGSLDMSPPRVLVDNSLAISLVLKKLNELDSKTNVQNGNIAVLKLLNNRVNIEDDDSDDDDDEGNKIDFSALDVNSLNLPALKAKRKEINGEIDRVEQDFGDTDELQSKLNDIEKRIRELEPLAKAVAQQQVVAPPPPAPVAKKPVSGGGGGASDKKTSGAGGVVGKTFVQSAPGPQLVKPAEQAVGAPAPQHRNPVAQVIGSPAAQAAEHGNGIDAPWNGEYFYTEAELDGIEKPKITPRLIRDYVRRRTNGDSPSAALTVLNREYNAGKGGISAKIVPVLDLAASVAAPPPLPPAGLPSARRNFGAAPPAGVAVPPPPTAPRLLIGGGGGATSDALPGADAAAADVGGGVASTSQKKHVGSKGDSSALAAQILKSGGGGNPASAAGAGGGVISASVPQSSAAIGGDVASAETQIIDQIRAFVDAGGKYENTIKQYLEGLIADGAEEGTDRTVYLNGVSRALENIKSGTYYNNEIRGIARNKVGNKIDEILSAIKQQAGAQRNRK